MIESRNGVRKMRFNRRLTVPPDVRESGGVRVAIEPDLDQPVPCGWQEVLEGKTFDEVFVFAVLVCPEARTIVRTFIVADGNGVALSVELIQGILVCKT